MSTAEQELKRLLHYGRSLPFYQPANELKNELYHPIVLSTIENLLATETDAANCILKAFSDGYSVYPSMLVYALVVCAKQTTSEQLREAAYKAAKTVCASPENLFLFVKYAKKLSQNNSIWGSGFRKVWKDWYLKKDPKALAEIVGRHRSCFGGSHKNIIRLIHLKTDEPARAAVIKYILFGIKAAKKEFGENAEANEVLNYLQTIIDFKRLTDEQQAARSIEIYKLSLDHVPPQLLKCKEVWSALLGTMPLPVLLNNLERIGYLGFLKGSSPFVEKVIDALKDGDSIAESRLHPAQVYVATRSYEMSSKFVAAENAKKKRRTQNGSGDPKKVVKVPPKPNPDVVSALHNLFAWTSRLFLAPTGLRFFVAVDIRNFAPTEKCFRCPHLSPAEAAALTALCLLHADRNVLLRVAGPNDQLLPVPMTNAMTVHQAVAKLEETRMHRMKLTAPLEWALRKKESHEVFVLITDTFHKGSTSVVPVLQKYRKEMQQGNAKFVLVLLKSNFMPSWVKETKDAGVFVVSGFDGNVPRLIEAFSRGAF